MKTFSQSLTELFSEAAHQAFPELSHPAIEITQSTQEEFGHYQCNSAMKMAKELKLPPRKIAETIVAQVSDSTIDKIEVAGPGFINITLKKEAIEKSVNRMLRDAHLGIEKPQHPQKIIVEFSSPNTAKELHVGHLRSTIIGDCLARIFEFLGHNVLRLNHIGDWGTQFGMLIAYMKEKAPDVLTGKQQADLPQLMQWYKESKLRFDTDAEFKKTAQGEVVSLQGGNGPSKKGWEILCDISRKGYQEIYDLLDVRLIERGESFYNPILSEVVSDLEQKNLLVLSFGAKCLFLEGFKNRDGDPLPLMIQKSDGGYTYDTTDMAAMKHRAQVEKADRIIIVTDLGQSTHFQMIFKGAELAGYYDPHKLRTDHVTFGLVLGPDGKKFRTRSGDTEKLIDLLTAAIDKARSIVEEKNPERGEAEKQEIAFHLGIGAIKYADLSTNRTSDYLFNYDKMLRFEGNTAAFLMYAYVRVNGIKRKIGIPIEEVLHKDTIHLEHPTEIALALHLAQFGEALEQVTQDLMPNRLTDYLYGLAQKFHAFFRDCRVEGSDRQASRLLLCETVALTMRQGLHLLGVETVERM